jgi:hypothetical protein
MQAGPSFLTTFIYYFATTALILTLVISQSTGLAIASGIPQQVGAIGGVLVGLVGIYFNRSVMVTAHFSDRKKFLTELEAILTTMDYKLLTEEEDIRVYERSGFRKWLSGRVFVQLEKQQATIATRAVHMRCLEPELQTKQASDRAAEIKQNRKDL